MTGLGHDVVIKVRCDAGTPPVLVGVTVDGLDLQAPRSGRISVDLADDRFTTVTVPLLAKSLTFTDEEDPS